MLLLKHITLDVDDLVPNPEYFTEPSELHGRLHVARVIVLGAKLIELTGGAEYAVPLWAATYIHDLGRQHDGYCVEHGKWSVQKVEDSPEIRGVLTRGGMTEEQWPLVANASIHHCNPVERTPEDEHFKLTHLLKDADGLDRVRLGDLNPKYLRHPEAHSLITFAEKLFRVSSKKLSNHDPRLMSKLLKID